VRDIQIVHPPAPQRLKDASARVHQGARQGRGVADGDAGAKAGDCQGRYAHTAMRSRARKRANDQPTRRVVEILVVCAHPNVLGWAS
jgi:hypothetical protein